MGGSGFAVAPVFAMTKMIATSAFKYGTRALQPNDEFDAENDEHAVCLEAANKARRAHVGQGYQTRQLLADQVNAPQLGHPKRPYRTRAQKAKEQ